MTQPAPVSPDAKDLILRFLMRMSVRELLDLGKLVYFMIAYRLDHDPFPYDMNSVPPANYWPDGLLRGIMEE